MLTRIWDWLFKRYTYEVIEKHELWTNASNDRPSGFEYILKRSDGMIISRKFW